VRVLDLTRNIAGPYCTLILADLGADVIKVEAPGAGDDTRVWGPPFWNGQSPLFLAFNRDKRGISLDLRDPGARPILEQLVRTSDVLVESFRHGSLEAMGYGSDWARALNPRLIYCSITAYGLRGPRRDLPGYDPIMQAASGIMSVTGEPAGSPVRAGVALVDMGTGMWGALAVQGALLARQQTGQGQRVTVSLYETALAWMAYHIPAFWGTGESPGRSGSAAAMLAPYEAYPSVNGQVLICCGNDRLFQALARALGHPDWATDPRYVHNPDRVAHRQELYESIAAETRQRTTAELTALLDAAGVPCAPIQQAADAARDPQALALGIFQSLPHPDVPNFQSIGLPLQFDGERPALTRLPPRVGQDNAEVLRDLGFSPEDINRLVASPAMAGRPD
jgi:crotonobetainyl-CoA:carnitine CoA-transferase CaiB-like acyl-CoA transferase